MKTLPMLFAAVAAIALTACQDNPDADLATENVATDVAAPAPVELPPAVVASNTYRCRDNSLVYIDFLSRTGTIEGAAMANLKTEQTGPITMLTRAEGETSYVGEGYVVDGNGDTVTVTLPERSAQTCSA